MSENFCSIGPIIASKPFIIYSKPKRGAFETFRNGNKIETIWEDIKLFLETCTTATNLNNPKYLELSVYEDTYKASENREVSKKIFKDAKDTFGDYQTDPKIEGYPQNAYWDIHPKDLQKAIDFMVKGQPWPVYYLGPIQLIMSFYFKLVDPKIKKELEGQQFESFLLVFLSGKSSCSANLSFPFSVPDESFEEYLSQIKKYLPFDLEQENLRLYKSNKKGTLNYSRKI